MSGDTFLFLNPIYLSAMLWNTSDAHVHKHAEPGVTCLPMPAVEWEKKRNILGVIEHCANVRLTSQSPR